MAIGWTYAQLKAADAGLSPPASDLGAAAAALNAQTTPASYQDVALGEIQGILLLAGEWAKIKARAATPLSGTAADQAIVVAQAALDLVASKADSVSADHYPQFAGLMAVLVAAGDVSTASQAAINALAMPVATVPAWQPVVTDQDVSHARSL